MLVGGINPRSASVGTDSNQTDQETADGGLLYTQPMRRIGFLGFMLLALEIPIAYSAVTSATADRIWISPNPGTLDLIQLLTSAAEWPHSRSLVSVVLLAQQHTGSIPDNIVGPNTYEELRKAGAFKAMRSSGLKLALGVGAVKEQYCSADDSGLRTAIQDTNVAIDAVSAAGGTVSYLAIDEPFLSGRLPRCLAFTYAELAPVADRLQTYTETVQRDHPKIQIGLIEAYPSFNVDEFSAMLDMMRDRSVSPAFLHVDVDLRAVDARHLDLSSDMRVLQRVARTRQVPFGIIIWGYNGDADALFARDAETLAHRFETAFPTWADMPDQLIFSSWSESATGLRITPSNLPEGRPYTLTSLLLNVYRRYRGMTASSTGSAVAR